jgi:hypothetical protein
MAEREPNCSANVQLPCAQRSYNLKQGAMYGLVNALLTTERKACYHDILWWRPRVIGLSIVHGAEIPEPGQDKGEGVGTLLQVMFFFCSIVRSLAYCHTSIRYMVSCQDSVYCLRGIDDKKPERRRS